MSGVSSKSIVSWPWCMVEQYMNAWRHEIYFICWKGYLTCEIFWSTLEIFSTLLYFHTYLCTVYIVTSVVFVCSLFSRYVTCHITWRKRCSNEMVDTCWQGPCVLPAQLSKQPSCQPAIGHSSQKSKTNLKKGFTKVFSPKYNIAYNFVWRNCKTNKFLVRTFYLHHSLCGMGCHFCFAKGSNCTENSLVCQSIEISMIQNAINILSNEGKFTSRFHYFLATSIFPSTDKLRCSTVPTRAPKII